MKRTLTWRVLIVLALAAITPTVAVGVLAIWRAKSELERQVVRGNLALIRELGASLDSRLQGARRSLELAAATWADDRTPAGARADAAATNRFVRRLQREVPLLVSVGVYDVEGRAIAGDRFPVERDIGAHSFGGYVGDVTFSQDAPRVRIVVQARSRTGELVGSLVAYLDLSFITDSLAQARVGRGARLWVVDGSGVPVAASDGQVRAARTSLPGTHPAVDRALGEATEGSVEADGNVAVYRNLSTYQSLRGVPWAAILEQSERDAYALARETTKDTVIAVVAALAVALLVGAALATRLIRPLERLTARADAIARGEHVRPLAGPIAGPGEIGVLAEQLEEMARRLAERERLKDALARGDRLAAVGTMSASIAHEINNPLTAVLGYAKLLVEDKNADHPDFSGLTIIAEEAARMQTKVRELLDYSRSPTAGGDGRSLRADVNLLLEKTAALLGPALLQQQVDMLLELDHSLPPVAADEHALKQVFVNLAHNAAQAMEGGGRLTVITSPRPGSAAVEVVFSDTGPGVPPADRERIFDPFYTTKGAGAGTGLGLAVARHLVTRCCGTITVEEGRNGQGACFRVVLPVCR